MRKAIVNQLFDSFAEDLLAERSARPLVITKRAVKVSGAVGQSTGAERGVKVGAIGLGAGAEPALSWACAIATGPH
jgi:hypothetical protein